MGNTSYDSSNRVNVSYRSSTGETYASRTAYFNSASVDEIFAQQKERKAHESMSPMNLGKRVCADSDTHPFTVPIIINLDVTGSMGRIPQQLIKDGLPTLMSTLIQNGTKDASLLFVAIGDHTCDKFPLQVGQFESGDEELDLWLTRTYLEGSGGGNNGESYLLAWLVGAFHTQLDSFDKRGKKGFLFTIGDEPCLNNLSSSAVRELIGSGERSYTAEELLNEAKKMYNVYHLHVTETSSGKASIGYWKSLMGQNCIEINDTHQLPKIISDTILSHEDTVVTSTDNSNSIIDSEIML